MDINGNQSGSVANVTSLLARVAATKNQENRELINEPVQRKEAQEPSKVENSSVNSTVAPADAASTQASSQVTGKLVNVHV